MGMVEISGWQTVALRLLLTVIAGFLIGLNRGEHARPAGLRTTVLICLAASVSMIQANLLLGTAGKAPDSYVVLDLMRLPLGILTGVGFIGAGAIFRRNDLLLGVTTAATLWFVTVIGLCFGGGQIGLGIAATVLALAVLTGMKVLERHIPQEKYAMLVISARSDGPTAEQVRDVLARARFRIVKFSEDFTNGEQPRRTMRCNIRWRGLRDDTHVPAAIDELVGFGGVLQLTWKP